MEESEPKEVSLVLPGWGEWTGPNFKVSSKKRKMFRYKEMLHCGKMQNLYYILISWYRKLYAI